MIHEVAKLHILALPHTNNSRRGVKYISFLYQMVNRLGYVKLAKRNGNIVGVVAGFGKLILTLAVHPKWQRKGIGRELVEELKGKRWVYTEQQSVGFYEKVGFEKILKIGKIIFLCRK
jgi:ribosomal protein S18 acetylase RimI-like enzyme